MAGARLVRRRHTEISGMIPQTVIDNFHKAAATYDAAADIQAVVADTLVQQIRHLNPASILDIGCGTGLVTERLAALWPEASIMALDSSAAMLDHVRRKVPRAVCVQGDAAAFHTAATFDLITSSMVLHWLPDPAVVLQRWQRMLSREAGRNSQRDGTLAVAVPLDGSLREWQALCRDHGLMARLWPFPELRDLDTPAETDVRDHHATYDSAHVFLETLRKTGAQTPKHGPRHAPDALRRLLRAAPAPWTISYRIGYCQYRNGR